MAVAAPEARDVVGKQLRLIGESAGKLKAQVIAQKNVLDDFYLYSSGQTYLSHAGQTPFFYAACPAWNGTLTSIAAAWECDLKHRAVCDHAVAGR